MVLHYDLHTHILPEIDDGARSVEESLVLIDFLAHFGVTNICFTPHMYSHKESIDDFLLNREQSFQKIKGFVPDNINIKLGAEVYVTKYLFTQEKDLRALCIEGTDYMITEFSYSSKFTGDSMRHLLRLRDYGIIPIIPHVERYPKLMKDKKLLEDLIYMGVIVQSNFISFTQPVLRRKLIKLLKSGHIHLLSSDVHNENRNGPQTIKEAVNFISKKCGASVLRMLNNNAQEVFDGI